MNNGFPWHEFPPVFLARPGITITNQESVGTSHFSFDFFIREVLIPVFERYTEGNTTLRALVERPSRKAVKDLQEVLMVMMKHVPDDLTTDGTVLAVMAAVTVLSSHDRKNEMHIEFERLMGVFLHDLFAYHQVDPGLEPILDKMLVGEADDE